MEKKKKSKSLADADIVDSIKNPVKRTKKKAEKVQDTVKVDNCKKYFTKRNIVFSLMLLFDILVVIYFARKNVVFEAKILDKKIYVGKERNLYFGRNYINLVITIFFYLYYLVMNHFYFKRKNTTRFVIFCLLFLFIVNVLFFFLFTNRV